MDNAAAVDIPVAPGNTTPEVVGIRRSSTGNFSIQNSETKPIPNYLRVRALTGSCHDFCKYGMRRHDVETKSEMYRRHAKTAKSTLHKEKLVNKDAEKKVPTNTNSVSVSAKHTGDSKLKLPSTQTPGSTNRQNGGNKPGNSILSRKTRVPPTSSPSKAPSLKSRNINIPKKVPKLENKKSETEKTTDYENVPEKTLFVIDESRSDNQKTDSRAEKSRRMRNENGDGSLRKLEFKKGKLLEIPSESSNCRVLKIRQAKTLNEIPNDKAECKEKNLRKLVSDGCSIGTDDNFSRVVLRPQGVGKKDTSPSLYNSLIKKTASKLVRTRKSRVKALVGAFETVITLQNNKSSRTFRTF
ncbi:unnamed protein product [Fraxinus pennsylvanica]|uniref:Calmodulin-binding domain-containing protein n=1 Tax=Fraxinus pennsylvanica TaxID=56036 RepID=A0AAD2AFW4_9LAMI|nr:unnamed protein product [Fraxinus pennsylvanica]